MIGVVVAMVKGAEMWQIGRDMYQMPHLTHEADTPTKATRIVTCHGPDMLVNLRHGHGGWPMIVNGFNRPI